MLSRTLTIEIARVTEAAAIAAAHWRGRGDEKQADQAAVDAMRQALNSILDMDGLVVIGEGERDEAPMLYIGEKVGSGTGQRIDIALDPLEGTTLCAKAMPNAIACVAMAEGGSLLHAPDTYMDKIAIGGGYPEGVVDLDLPPAENIERLAKAKGVPPREITACILDRPRHEALIQAVRETGASIRLITDGDVAGVIHTAIRRKPASISTWVLAARRRACSLPRRCAALAGRCRAGSSPRAKSRRRGRGRWASRTSTRSSR